MKKKWMPLVSAVFIFCWSLPMAWAKENPDDMLKRVTQEVITSLKQHDAELKQDPQLIYRIVDQVIVPYIDWAAMSGWVIGRNAWGRATAVQRDAFIKEFKTLLIHTYASTLKAYENQTIDYLPVRGGVSGKTRVQIASLIKEPGRSPIRVSYRMVDKGDAWKVYDISIEGVSLLKGFQSQFSTELQQGGMNTLIERLRKHNAKPTL